MYRKWAQDKRPIGTIFGWDISRRLLGASKWLRSSLGSNIRRQIVFLFCVSTLRRACPHENSPTIQARTTKFWQKKHRNVTKADKTLVKIPINFWVDWPWPSRSNWTWESKFIDAILATSVNATISSTEVRLCCRLFHSHSSRGRGRGKDGYSNPKGRSGPSGSGQSYSGHFRAIRTKIIHGKRIRAIRIGTIRFRAIRIGAIGIRLIQGKSESGQIELEQFGATGIGAIGIGAIWGNQNRPGQSNQNVGNLESGNLGQSELGQSALEGDTHLHRWRFGGTLLLCIY